MTKILTISIIALSIFNLTACTKYEAYKSEKISFDYPENYSVFEMEDENQILKIEGENGRLEIYKKSEEEIIHGFSSSGIEEFEAKLVPKEKNEKGDYELWLFYEEGDEEIKDELNEILESFKVL